MRVKICCIKNLIEAQMAVDAGATEIGLVGQMPTGPGVIEDHMIREIASQFNSQVNTVLLTSEQTSEFLITHIKKVRVRSVQIVRELPTSHLEQIKEHVPGILIFQVVHVENEEAITRAIDYARFADTLLLDSGKPSQAILGGTGLAHDWQISRQIVDAVDIPVFLAGGLNAANVRAAVEQVRPAGVDVCSGLRTKGNLDQTKVTDFVGNLKGHD